MAVITISRQYGSGGEEVAQHICEILGYRYFDKTMMAQVAAEMGLLEERVIDFSETDYRVRSFLDRLLGRSRVVAEVEILEQDETTEEQRRAIEKLNEEQCIELVQTTIHAAYKYGNLVIIGRGGQAVLKDAHGVLHVRIEAPQGARVMRIQEEEGLNLGEARARARERDAAAAAFVERFYGADWSNPLHYHMVLNTGRWGLNSVAKIIANAVTELKTVSHA